jgi:hypothetical protein
VFRGTTHIATTDATGTATVTGLQATGRPGSYEVRVSYPGSDRYSPSQTVATLRIGN